LWHFPYSHCDPNSYRGKDPSWYSRAPPGPTVTGYRRRLRLRETVTVNVPSADTVWALRERSSGKVRRAAPPPQNDSRLRKITCGPPGSGIHA
jgi:hypothetical protein